MSRMLCAFALCWLPLAGLSAASAAESPRAEVTGSASAGPDRARLLAQAEVDTRSSRAEVGGPVEPAPVLRRPSGFWTSGRPAVGGAYRYRLLAIGVGVFACTLVLMVWLIRRYPLRRGPTDEPGTPRADGS